jgi:hypothetical protein
LLYIFATMGTELSDQELSIIAEQSGIEEDVIKSWYKEFLVVCPKGKMVGENSNCIILSER